VNQRRAQMPGLPRDDADRLTGVIHRRFLFRDKKVGRM
jgi:hypothetical protein